MSTAPEKADSQQQKVTEFMRLLPLIAEIAGLPHSATGSIHYNEDQMSVRANTLRTAFKVARQLVRDIAGSQ